MRRFSLNKLVRDGVYDGMVADGQHPHLRELTDAEYAQALVDKLQEETGELDLSDPEQILKELGDRQEVADELARVLGSSPEAVRTLADERHAKVGGFAARRYVVQLDLEDGDRWVEYYAADPRRFPEITE